MAEPIPSIQIGSVAVPRLIMGHLPFLGESYQGETRNKEYSVKFSTVTNTINIIAKAINDYGITTLAITSAQNHLSRLLFDAIKEARKTTGVDVSLLPCFSIPLTIDGGKVDDYRRWVTYYKYERRLGGIDIVTKFLKDPILLCRPGWEKKFPKAVVETSPYNQKEIDNLQINYSGLDKSLASIKKFRVLLAEAGSESDFLTMVGRYDLLENFVTFLKKELGSPVVLGVHHAGITIPILEEIDVDIVGIVTPVNDLGALMLPTQTMALKAITSTKRPIIAIKPLAGGRIRPERAFKYVFQRVRVAAAMVGVASEAEIDADIPAACKFIIE